MMRARGRAAMGAGPAAPPRPAAGAGRGPRGRALLAPARLLLIALALLGFFALGAPLQRWLVRRRPAAAAYLPKLFCRTMLRLVGVAVEVRGMAAPGAALLASNHVSWIDIPALAALTPFCFLAKAEVARWPLVSAFAAVQGTVFVDRRRRRSILPANRAMAARLGEGRRVLFFPEGTTLAGPLPGPFLPSHFAAAGLAGAVVQPVAVRYSAAAAAWVGDETLLGHLWRTLVAPPLRCTISFGEPIPSGGGRKAVAIRARASVSELLAGREASGAGGVAVRPGSPTGASVRRPARPHASEQP